MRVLNQMLSVVLACGKQSQRTT